MGAGDDDPHFEGLFTGSGPVEPSAKERELAAAREAAASRARSLRDQQFYGDYTAGSAAPPLGEPRRRRNIKGPLNRIAQIAVVVVALAAAGWWVAGNHGAHHNPKPAAPVTPAGPAGVRVATGETTTTLLGLGNFAYTAGACVTWNQSDVGEAPTSQVPCSQPHLVEVVGAVLQVTGFGSTYPGDATLAAYYRKQCLGPSDKYLGYALDPGGRFADNAVGPAPSGWADGDRTAWCTLDLKGNPVVFTAFTGEVRGANQEFLVPIGSCGSPSGGEVSCAGVHDYQVSGNVNLTGVATYPRTDQAMQSAVGAECGTIGRSFVGGAYPPGVEAGWLDLSATSWADGERTVQCTVAKYTANGQTPIAIKGSLAKKAA